MTSYNTRELELAVRQQGVLFHFIMPFRTKHLKELLDHLSKKKRKEGRNG